MIALAMGLRLMAAICHPETYTFEGGHSETTCQTAYVIARPAGDQVACEKIVGYYDLVAAPEFPDGSVCIHRGCSTESGWEACYQRAVYSAISAVYSIQPVSIQPR